MIDRKDDNFGRRMIPEPDLNYLQQVIKNNPDPQDVGRGTAVTYDAGEGIKIPDNKTIEIDTDVVALKTDIPTVGEGVVTIQVNGATVDSFSVNRSNNKTVNIPVEVVSANTGATPTATLTDIQVGTVTYEVPQGGGTNVVANPTVTTDTLNSIQIGNVGYQLPMMYTLEDYYSGSNTPIQLTQAQYDIIASSPMINFINLGTGYSYISGCYLLGRKKQDTDNTTRVFYHNGYSSDNDWSPTHIGKIRLLRTMSEFGGEPGVMISHQPVTPVTPTSVYRYKITAGFNWQTSQGSAYYTVYFNLDTTTDYGSTLTFDQMRSLINNQGWVTIDKTVTTTGTLNFYQAYADTDQGDDTIVFDSDDLSTQVEFYNLTWFDYLDIQKVTL